MLFLLEKKILFGKLNYFYEISYYLVLFVREYFGYRN